MSTTVKESVQRLRGKWIVFEGPDRIGKTTLINNFIRYLKSNGLNQENIAVFAFPQRTSHIGKLIVDHLQYKVSLDGKPQVMLFLADMLHAFKEISAALSANKVVICDRYTASTFSYAMAQVDLKNHHSNICMAWLKNAISLVQQPNFYFFLLPEETGYQNYFTRPGFGEERTETSLIQEKVVMYMKHYALEHVDKPIKKIVLIAKAEDSPSKVLNTLTEKLNESDFD